MATDEEGGEAGPPDFAGQLQIIAEESTEEQLVVGGKIIQDATAWVRANQDGFGDGEEARALATLKFIASAAREKSAGGFGGEGSWDRIRRELKKVARIIRRAVGDSMKHRDARGSVDQLLSTYDSSISRANKQRFDSSKRKIDEAIRNSEPQAALNQMQEQYQNNPDPDTLLAMLKLQSKMIYNEMKLWKREISEFDPETSRDMYTAKLSSLSQMLRKFEKSEAETQQQIHGAGHHRMIAGKQTHIFASERVAAREGAHEAFLGQLGKAVGCYTAVIEQVRAVAEVFDVHAEVIEDAHHKTFELFVGAGLADGLDKCVGGFWSMGVQLQQTIAATLELFGKRAMFGGGFGDELFKFFGVRKIRRQRQHLVAELLQQLVRAMQITFQRLQPLVIPTRQHLLRTALEVRRVHVDGLGLADAIEPADALLEQLRIQRQIKQHEVVHKLKVAPFAANL